MERLQEETRPLNTYHIQISSEAQRGLLSLSTPNRRLVIDAIEALSENPRPTNSKLLYKAENLRRLTIGDYRVLYGIQESNSTITVELIRHRSIVYTLLGALAIAVRTKRYSR
jgi:mRNA-degrading endonuclease RelE of RelBE toxin-antitoxin system